MTDLITPGDDGYTFKQLRINQFFIGELGYIGQKLSKTEYKIIANADGTINNSEIIKAEADIVIQQVYEKKEVNCMTKVINLFAGPGAGKSTVAAGLFHTMKKVGESVELVQEFAKEKVYDNHLNILQDQLYVCAKQNRRISRLIGQVDYIITDSPVLLSAYYSKYNNIKLGLLPSLCPLVKELHLAHDNINIFLHRTYEYEAKGRLGSEEDAKEADKCIKQLLSEVEQYYYFDNDDCIVENILGVIQ